MHFNYDSCILDVWILYWNVVCWLVWIELSPWCFYYCISHAHAFFMHTYLHFFIFLYWTVLCFSACLSLSPSLFLVLVCSMAPKRKSTPSRNPLRSRASSSSSPSDSTPSHIRFRDDKAHKDFSKNFSWWGIHSECQVVLSDFSNTDIPTVIYSKGWESLCGIPVTCPSVIIQEFYSKMHGFDYLVPHFVTRVWGRHIVVTPNLISEVLHAPRVEFADYLDCERLKTMSKDELLSRFCKTPSSWGDRQNTPSVIAKDPRFLNMLMKFVFHPFYHYNSITKPCAQFLLSLLKGLTIDFPFHFILSLIDIYRDTATRNKLIFPSAITQILRHFSVSYPESTHFSSMCAIDATTIRQSEAKLQSKWPRTETATPLTSSAPSTFTPSSSVGGVTFKAVMTQLQRMDAHLNTLSDELCQVNTRVSRIAWWQARRCGFLESPSPSPEASEEEDDDGDSDDDDDDEDENEYASFSGDDEMTAWFTYSLSFVTKKGE